MSVESVEVALEIVAAQRNFLEAIDRLAEARQRWPEPSGIADTLQASVDVNTWLIAYARALTKTAEFTRSLEEYLRESET